MKEEFEEGEEVMVRNYHWEHWQKRYYIDTVESKDTGLKWYRTYAFGEEPGNHKCDFVRWSQIRKIQKPEPTNKPEPIEFWVGRLQTQVMSLMDRLSKIEDELRIKSMNKPVKKQLK